MTESREKIQKGINPRVARKLEKHQNLVKGENDTKNSFRNIAEDWFKTKIAGKSKGHVERVRRQLDNDLIPWLGGLPIVSVTPPHVLECLREIEKRGAIETARRTKNVASQVFDYAIAIGIATNNPTVSLGAALKTAKSKNFKAVVEPKRLGEILRLIDHNESLSFVTKSALQLAPLVFARPGELGSAKWCEIDFVKEHWQYHVSKTDVERHIVPLSKQAIAILAKLKGHTAHYSVYLFPQEKDPNKFISENTLTHALKRIGASDQTAHGFRATAETMLQDELEYPKDWIEHQLAHSVKDANGTAYNRAKFLKKRQEMMQTWADYLEGLSNG